MLEDGRPRMTSNVGERIWGLLPDTKAFKREVTEYFNRGYPGWTVTGYNEGKRRIYLRDDRGV